MSTHSLSKMKTRLWRTGLHFDSSLKLRAGLHREVHAFFLRSRQRQMVISLPPPAFVLKCMRSNALSRTLGAFPRCAQCGHLLVLTLPVVSTRFGMGAFCVVLVWFAYFGLRYALVLWVHVLMDFLAVFTLKYIKAPGPSGDRGGWPWRASPVVPSLRRISDIVPLVPARCTVVRSMELLATTVGEWRRRHSLRRHKAGTWTAVLPPGSRVRCLSGVL